MKKYINIKGSICLLFTLFLLCGCGERGKTVPVTKQISFIADIESGGEKYSCRAQAGENGELSLEVLEPAELEGLKINFCGEAVSVEFLGLCYTPSSGNMPLAAAAVRLRNMLLYCSGGSLECRDKVCIYKGRLPDGEYSMLFSPSGLPLSAELSNGSFSVEFKDMRIIS